MVTRICGVDTAVVGDDGSLVTSISLIVSSPDLVWVAFGVWSELLRVTVDSESK